MKCIRNEYGEIIRVSNGVAKRLVDGEDTGFVWEYCSKSEWKKQKKERIGKER